MKKDIENVNTGSLSQKAQNMTSALRCLALGPALCRAFTIPTRPSFGGAAHITSMAMASSYSTWESRRGRRAADTPFDDAVITWFVLCSFLGLPSRGSRFGVVILFIPKHVCSVFDYQLDFLPCFSLLVYVAPWGEQRGKGRKEQRTKPHESIRDILRVEVRP